VAALEFHGPRRVDASPAAAKGRCPVLMLVVAQRGSTVAISAAVAAQTSRGWQEVARERRPTDRSEVVVVYRRAGAAASRTAETVGETRPQPQPQPQP
jgi:hypothetical protein